MPAPATPGEPEGVVTVWWAHRSLATTLDDALLSDTERHRVARLRAHADRERSAVARGVLRLALATVIEERPQDIAIDWEHGPVLASSLGTWASVSHSDDAVAVAVSTAGPIGIDVEAMRRTGNLAGPVQEAVFTPQERAELAALPAEGRRAVALRLWTLKEAVLKSTGDGLVRAPSSLEITRITTRPELTRFEAREDLVGGTQLYGFTPALDQDGAYVASLAVLAAEPLQVVERSAAELLA